MSFSSSAVVALFLFAPCLSSSSSVRLFEVGDSSSVDFLFLRFRFLDFRSFSSGDVSTLTFSESCCCFSDDAGALSVVSVSSSLASPLDGDLSFFFFFFFFFFLSFFVAFLSSTASSSFFGLLWSFSISSCSCSSSIAWLVSRSTCASSSLLSSSSFPSSSCSCSCCCIIICNSMTSCGCCSSTTSYSSPRSLRRRANCLCTS
mmetsp:Transcript_17331/g.37836  ORF Transcript_17331/g.37836 Transcript_17331/m.37836 type:complete len:203 (+) Transcript_17331:379-987(+)